MTMNKAILIGNLGRDPETKEVGDQNVTHFNIATTERWKNKDGDSQERTEWHRIVVWGKLGDACAKYLSKGSKVYIEGKIQSRKYTNKDEEEKTVYEIIAQNVQFLDSKAKSDDDSRDTDAPRSTKPKDKPKPKGDDAQRRIEEMEDDIPF